jgi:hypothetical protein
MHRNQQYCHCHGFCFSTHLSLLIDCLSSGIASDAGQFLEQRPPADVVDAVPVTTIGCAAGVPAKTATEPTVEISVFKSFMAYFSF